MATIQDLSKGQTVRALADALAKGVPLTLSYRSGSEWRAVHSRLLAINNRLLYAQPPRDEQGLAVFLPAGTDLGLTFKLGHHKHLGNVSIESLLPASDGSPAPVLCLTTPDRMQRVQRRAYYRVDTPPNRSILATLWEGSLPADPAGPPKGHVAWEGWVTNLSAGGFQLRLPTQAAPPLEAGDIVAVRLDVGAEFGLVLAEAQFRHAQADPRGVSHLGFQFVGLNETPEGRQMLRKIAHVVCDFQRCAPRERRDEHADESHPGEPPPAAPWRRSHDAPARR